MSVKIGITGGIGSGKSVVSQLFRMMGIPVYDSDSQAKMLTQSDQAIKSKLSALLGKELYKDGVLDKSLLSAYLFESPENTARINEIIHPCVKGHFIKWVSEHNRNDIVALESAILVEAGFTDCVDKVVCVVAPLELRVQRAASRDHSSEELIRKRIKSQIGDPERIRSADFVLSNDGETPLIPQVLRLISQLKEPPHS